ncbi:MAG: cache domain-containing protein, partial [Deltaproteobacteria bacterium]|nr:cache domain-containing protein [Deltaproteobacteria bacterium]
MNRIRWFSNLPIRYKLLLAYSGVFVLTLAVGSPVLYSLVRGTIERGIESQLKSSTEAIFTLVRTSAGVAIRNHLRAVAEKNREIVAHFHRQQRQGLLSEKEAKARAAGVLLSQTIGTTGSVYGVDSAGVVVLHRDGSRVGVKSPEHALLWREQPRKEGYLEYELRMPGKDRPRPKALYMTYFAPWDWIVSVSAYRDEFDELVGLSDLRQSILSLKFGGTGYCYVLDGLGNAIIHPTLEGKNVFDHGDQAELPAESLREMLDRKSGKIVYSWKGPGEERPRERLVIFDSIPEYGWLVASSSYLDEFYAPLRTVRNIFFAAVLGSLVLVLALTVHISASITNPLKELMDSLAAGATGDFFTRVSSRSSDEVGRLAAYFNTFMERFVDYNASLQAEIRQRRRAEEALRESRERYRLVMEAAPDPIVVYDVEGRVTYFNPAYTRVFGWTLDECLGKRMDHFVPDDCWPETRRMIEVVLAGQTLSGAESRRLTRDGDTIHVSISGAAYRGQGEGFAGSVIILRDVTEKVKARKAARLSEEMFSKAFRSSPNGISIETLKDMRFLNVNEAFLELTGFDREEVMGRAPIEIGLLRSPEEGRRLMEELRRQGQLRGYEIELRTKAGDLRLVRVSAEVIQILDEPCMLATLEDVTEWRRLQREIIEAGDRERRKIGKELHDDLGPHLIGIEVLSKVLARKLEEKGLSETAAAEKIKGLVAQAIRKTRALARGLCPVHLADNGLEFALGELAENTRTIFGVPCVFRAEEQVPVDDNAVATEIFYIAREAIHNAVKHAEAKAITVELGSADHGLVLRIRDDGRGISQPPDGEGMGLRIMAFRASMIGASLRVESSEGNGTTVTLTIAGDTTTEP